MEDGEKSANKFEAATGASNGGPLKANVQRKGHQLAIDRAVERFVHKRERNEIQERDTYARSCDDPRRSKG
jgi:hypothetical protein